MKKILTFIKYEVSYRILMLLCILFSVSYLQAATQNTYIANSDYSQGLMNAAQNISPISNDNYIASNCPNICYVTQPLSGKATILPGNKTVLYTPNRNFTGVDIFFYALKDRYGRLSNETSISIYVLPTNNASNYSIVQAVSDKAQLSTIAFSGLAFITGNAGADTFFPPGKVADFFGFQYMRDVDAAGYGHNTTFLSRAANNVLYILNDNQKAKLVNLAKIQAPIYVDFAYNRLPLMNAFRRNLEGNLPSKSSNLNVQTVSKYTANLYRYDAELSYNRAIVLGEIINSFTADQKVYLGKMKFNDYSTWPDVAEDQTLKKGMTNNEFIAVMTYASEMFSWYKGSLDADVYFCPERHGTYFGGFFMKDYPAMNNPNYFISTALTGDSGEAFLNVLNTNQKALITSIIPKQKSALSEIVKIRTAVSYELRKAITGGVIDKYKVYALIQRYGELDGQMSALYATQFAAVNKTLTASQRASLIKIRNLDVVPKGGYRFSTPVDMPVVPNTDYMFGSGAMPASAGQTKAPASFGL